MAKANAKAQEKQQKRTTEDGKEVRKRVVEKMTAIASQSMNRRGLKEDGSGGSKDVRLEGVDISIGTKFVLESYSFKHPSSGKSCVEPSFCWSTATNTA